MAGGRNFNEVAGECHAHSSMPDTPASPPPSTGDGDAYPPMPDWSGIQGCGAGFRGVVVSGAPLAFGVTSRTGHGQQSSARVALICGTIGSSSSMTTGTRFSVSTTGAVKTSSGAA